MVARTFTKEQTMTNGNTDRASDVIELTENQLDTLSGGSSPRAFEIKDFSFGIENPTTIGSATSGAGAGK